MERSDLETVFATYDKALIAVCESQLHGRGIRYHLKNQLLQEMTYPGVPRGPMEIQVSPEDADMARRILRPLDREPAGESKEVDRSANKFMIFFFVLLLVVIVVGLIVTYRTGGF
jgi:hypothetical protein